MGDRWRVCKVRTGVEVFCVCKSRVLKRSGGTVPMHTFSSSSSAEALR